VNEFDAKWRWFAEPEFQDSGVRSSWAGGRTQRLRSGVPASHVGLETVAGNCEFGVFSERWGPPLNGRDRRLQGQGSLRPSG